MLSCFIPSFFFMLSSFFMLSCDDWSCPFCANAECANGSDKLHMSIPPNISFFIVSPWTLELVVRVNLFARPDDAMRGEVQSYRRFSAKKCATI
jgi:hypothetical protein